MKNLKEKELKQLGYNTVSNNIGRVSSVGEERERNSGKEECTEEEGKG